jgi:hypothetical protein
MLFTAHHGIVFQVEDIETVVRRSEALLSRWGLDVQCHRVTAGEIQLLFVMRAAVGDGDMRFGIIDLDIAVGIDQDLFFVPFAGRKACKNQEYQETGISLHNQWSVFCCGVCFTKKVAGPGIGIFGPGTGTFSQKLF